MKPLKQRVALRWHGGKWMLAPWILSHFPQHRIYTEAFGGAASVLLRKPIVYSEVYNDLDGEVVNFFRVLQDMHKSRQLKALLSLTPFARQEFKLSYELCVEPVERARRLVIRSFMGHGSNAHNLKTPSGFRANSNRSGTTPAHDWDNYAKSLHMTIARFKRVTIEHRPATEVLKTHDRKDTLHYVDPPYVHATRTDNRQDYHTELTDRDHLDLLKLLKSLRGAVVLSGYPHPMYDKTLKGWGRVEREALADGARKRTEVLWIKKAVK